MQQAAVIVMGLDQSGRDHARASEAGEGLVEAVERGERFTQMIVGFGGVRRDRKRLRKTAGGLVMALQRGEGLPEIVMRLDESRLERDRGSVGRQRLLEATERVQRGAQG